MEIYVDGRDVPLVRAGRLVRLEFEGWPAIQFSGWPVIAKGMFDGRVRSVDPATSPNGMFRILIEPAPDKPAWPDRQFVRLGGKVRGWVQGEVVSAGYELWRTLNDFPLNFGGQRTATADGTRAAGGDDREAAAKAGKVAK